MVLFRRLLLVILVAAVVVSCDQVDFTAPAGSVLTITVQPTSVGPGGIATLTVTGIRPNGAPLPDETSITFTTTLGSIDPNPVKTKDGTAFARFRAGTRSGTATVTATSGPNENVTTEILVGQARPSQVVLSALPSTLPLGGGSVELRAHVSDENGDPVNGVSVFFETTSGELNSSGRTVQTNQQGVATDILTTTLSATVTATTANAVEDTVEITVGTTGEVPCLIAVSPTDPAPGEDVTFTSIGGTGEVPIRRHLWNFGDGDTDEGLSVVHSYDTVGNFVVVLTVVDELGQSASCTADVVVSFELPSCGFVVTPDEPVEGSQVFFDASQSTADSGIATFEWSFGDGTGAVESDPFTNHVYTFPGCGGGSSEPVQVGLIITDNEGQTNFCSQTIEIECQ